MFCAVTKLSWFLSVVVETLKVALFGRLSA